MDIDQVFRNTVIAGRQMDWRDDETFISVSLEIHLKKL
jgi:hypothetical protein